MDFYDEMCQAIARDGARRGVRVKPEEFQKLLNNIAPPPIRTAAEPPQPPPEIIRDRHLDCTVEYIPQSSPAPAAEQTLQAPLPGDWESLRCMALSCRNCPLSATRQNVVFGEGDLRARLMFIGEGPGAEEDASGRPFVGAAGQLLDKMIAAMHLAREDVYIANIVKYRPPGNRMPAPEEAAACIGYLKKQIELIQPEVIVLLGGTALSFLLEINGITKYRGRWHNYNNIPVMPTFHPAFLLRKAEAKREAWHDLKLVMAKLGIAV
jgi:DNA polymerase